MGVGEWLRHLLGREQIAPDSEALAREEAIREQIRQRCLQFRHLLRANKRTLEWISDIEEHLAGEKAFGMNYIRASSAEIVANVFKMIRALNALSNNQYGELQVAFDRIREKLNPLLTPIWHGQDGPYILPLTGIGLADLSQVGGKMANLGEIVSHAGLKVPAGFVVTVAGYRRFMAYNDLGVELGQCIQSGTMRHMEGLLSLAQQLQQKILKASLPDDLRAQIECAVKGICGGHDKILLAVRSSAVGEDSLGASFAGQYRTEINVHPDEVCDVWKEIVASKYTASALSYRYQRGIPDEDAPMGVGVLAMVDARVGGVAYSRDPLKDRAGDERIVVNAVHGLPAAVVDGGVTPDAFMCSHHNPPVLVESTLADDKNPALTSEEASHVARVALALEEYYAQPQDVEWAIDQNDTLIILQSRPLHRAIPENPCAAEGVSPKLDEAAIIVQGGVPVSDGVALGEAFVVQKDADMLAFPEKAILVIARAHPRWAALLPHASGLVSESGGVAGHLASVAREYGLPALFSLPDACTELANVGKITLDATNGVIYAGDQTQLLPCHLPKQTFMHGSPIWKRMREISRYIVPLNLLDPKSADFSPEHCMTMHDITRFCHEKAVNILFAQGNSETIDTQVGKQLKAGSKLQYWLVDMGGGFSHPVATATVGLNEIASKPMLALWDGMVCVPWNGPPVAGASGFMSIVLESTMKPELESTLASPMAERNFFIIGADYMILQARYGYHFCTVECQAGPQSHENFLSFQFKGGATDRERRFLRLQLFSEILEQQDFKVDIKDDALFAVAEDFDAEQTLRLTRLLGYLLIHSRQSDVIMKEADRVSLFRKKLLRDMEWIEKRPLPFV